MTERLDSQSPADKPSGAYMPLTREHIEKIRGQWPDDLYPSTTEFKTLCDMAVNSLLFSQEIERLRTRSAGTSINLEGRAGDANDVGAMIAAGITRAAAAADRLITINNIERFHAGDERLEPDPDGQWVRFSDAAAFSNRLASATRSASERTDGERMAWLAAPGRWITPHKGDDVKSWHEARKQAHFYINGRYTITEGATAREAIDAAMKATHSPADRSVDHGRG